MADGTTSAFTSTEIPDQIRLTRTRAAGTGHLLYNATSTLKKSNGAVTASLATLYASRALVPAMRWLDSIRPIDAVRERVRRTVQMIPAAGELPRWWVVRSRSGRRVDDARRVRRSARVHARRRSGPRAAHGSRPGGQREPAGDVAGALIAKDVDNPKKTPHPRLARMGRSNSIERYQDATLSFQVFGITTYRRMRDAALSTLQEL